MCFFGPGRYSRSLGTVLAAVLSLVAARGQSTPNPPNVPLIPPRAGYSFPTKETLTYAVDWRVFPAGTTVMHLQQDGDQERVSATGETLGAINLIYRVNDRFQSSFNRQTGCSAGFAKQLQEGRRQVSTDLKFDYARGKAVLNEKNLVKGTSKEQEATIGPCVTDLLSAIFYPASQPLTVGQSFPSAGGGCHAHGRCHNEGRSARNHQDAIGNVSDNSRAADSGCRRSEGAREYLDLVHGR